MIEKSKRNYGKEIIFQRETAEDISFNNIFNVIFCNSAFQWFHDAQKSIINFYRALKSKGRVGIQAPAKKEYCPNFIQAVKAIETDNTAGSFYRNFKSPWFFLNTAKEYAEMFLEQGFEVPFSEIQTIETFHYPEEVYNIFASGAAAGYLNQANYSCEITNEYINGFQNLIRKEFNAQAKYDGKVKLLFNRIFLVAVKP
jgi:trans-aconitate methyltransferase